MVVTCGAEEERDDGHVRHVADGGLEGQAEHHEGDAAVLDGGLQGDGHNLCRCGKFTVSIIVCPVLTCGLVCLQRAASSAPKVYPMNPREAPATSSRQVAR